MQENAHIFFFISVTALATFPRGLCSLQSLLRRAADLFGKHELQTVSTLGKCYLAFMSALSPVGFAC